MNRNIDMAKLAQIDALATSLSNIIDDAENISVPPQNKLIYLQNNGRPYVDSLNSIIDIISKIDFKSLCEDDKKHYLYSLNFAMSAGERYDQAVKRVQRFLQAAGMGTEPVGVQYKKPGRKRADINKHLRDFLVNCDADKVVEAIRNDPNRGPQPKYYYCLAAALIKKGYLIRDDTGTKELYYALKKDFKDVGSYDGFEDKFAKWKETADRNKTTVTKILDLF